MESTFNILTVCSGNICRSPLAEQLLRAHLTGMPNVTVASAGTIGLAGRTMSDQAAALSRRYGGDPSSHSARQLTEQHISDADLVFAMSREHRKAIVELVPRAIRYTFTLREFARIVSDFTDADFLAAAGLPLDDVPARLGALVQRAASKRGAGGSPSSPADDDIVDPYGQSDATYAESARQLVPAVEAIAPILRRVVEPTHAS